MQILIYKNNRVKLIKRKNTLKDPTFTNFVTV